MIQASIMVNHIIHGKVWNCRIQVFSKLVESMKPGLEFPYVGEEEPNIRSVDTKFHGKKKI